MVTIGSYYVQEIYDLKKEILQKMKGVVGVGEKISMPADFKIVYRNLKNPDQIYLHTCEYIEHDNKSGLLAYVRDKSGEQFVMHVEFCGIEAISQIMFNVERQIYLQKLNIINDIVVEKGGQIDLDGSFEFWCNDSECYSVNDRSKSMLIGLTRNDSKVLVNTRWTDDMEYYDYGLECIPPEEVDRVIEYLKDAEKRVFKIRVTHTFDGVVDVCAKNEEEAVKTANTMVLHNSDVIKMQDNGFSFSSIEK